MRVAKTSRGCVSEAEADDALWGGKCVLGLHDWGGEGIGRGGRTAGNGTNRTALAILLAEVTGS